MYIEKNASVRFAHFAICLAVVIVSQVGASGCVSSGDRATGKITPANSRFDLRISRAVDMHMYARVLAKDTEQDAPAGLHPALDAARQINDAIGSRSMSWWPLDARLAGCNEVADLRAAW